MKLLVLLAVLAVAWFVWRKGHRATPRAGSGTRSASPGAAGSPQEMVCCPVCQVHLPRGEALPGPDGALYCSAEHRRLRAGG